MFAVPEATVPALATQWAVDIENRETPPLREQRAPTNPISEAADRVLADLGATPAPPDRSSDRPRENPRRPVADPYEPSLSARADQPDENAIRELASRSLRGADQATRERVKEARKQARDLGIRYSTRTRRKPRRRGQGDRGQRDL